MHLAMAPLTETNMASSKVPTKNKVVPSAKESLFGIAERANIRMLGEKLNPLYIYIYILQR